MIQVVAGRRENITSRVACVKYRQRVQRVTVANVINDAVQDLDTDWTWVWPWTGAPDRPDSMGNEADTHDKPPRQDDPGPIKIAHPTVLGINARMASRSSAVVIRGASRWGIVSRWQA